MKIQLGFRTFVLVGALFIAGNVFGLGSDYFTNKVVQPSWPTGMQELVNVTNRVHGFFVNAEDLFFFQGGVAEFNSFLAAYSKISEIDGHELLVHEGVGDAKSPWEKVSRPCDWRLYGAPKRWLKVGEISAQGTNSAEAVRALANTTNYVLRVDFWTGGKIPFEQIKIPENVKVVRDAKTK